jgi:hypothetical protein
MDFIRRQFAKKAGRKRLNFPAQNFPAFAGESQRHDPGRQFSFFPATVELILKT